MKETVRKTTSSNGWKLLAITVIGIIAAAAGSWHVWGSYEVMQLRRQVYVELLRYRSLVQERENITRRMSELRAAPRVALRARELLGMRAPRPDEMIIVREEAGR